jgi:hypothetical protein
MINAWEGMHRRCAPVGQLEYVVESRHDGELETWYVVRPHDTYAPRCEKALGHAVPPGSRVVVEAASLRPVGVLASDLPEPAPMPAGYNPYFDLPPA